MYHTLEASGRISSNQCKVPEDGSAVFNESCRSLFYKQCEKYVLLPDRDCIIETRSNTKFEVCGQDVDILVWELDKNESGECSEERYLAPYLYEMGEALEIEKDEACGYKF